MYTVCYSQEAMRTFNRIGRFCKKEGIEAITPVHVLLEVMQNRSCRYLSDYLDRNYPDNDEKVVKRLAIWLSRELYRDKEEEKGTLTFTWFGKNHEFVLTKTLAEILQQIVKDTIESVEAENPNLILLEEVQLNIYIDCEAILNAILLKMPKDVKKYFNILGVDIPKMQKYLLKTEEGDESKVPPKMQSFLKEMKVEGNGKGLILGRDKEMKKIWNIISKKTKRNVILLGEPGVGKTAIVDNLVQSIASGKCPEKFKGYKVFKLEMASMIVGTRHQEDVEERLMQLTEFLEKSEKTILFIDEIHTMLGAGSSPDGILDLANWMKIIMAQNKTIVIGATTIEKYVMGFLKDRALNCRFEVVEVKEPRSYEVYPMLKNRIRDLEKYHGVRITEDMVDFIIFTAGCFDNGTSNPARTLDLLDKAMGVAKAHGKEVVDKESVLENFDVNYEMLANISEKQLRSVAYHEAGHFVTQEMCETQKGCRVTAISIMPAEDYMGVNIFEWTDEVVERTIQCVIDSIAVRMAGRVAEELILEKNNSGVSADLQLATMMAYEAVTKFGLIDEHQITYLNEGEFELMSEEAKNEIRDAVKQLVTQGKERAREILEQNRKLLDAVVEALMDKKMLSRRELDCIIAEIKKQEQTQP